MERIIPHIPPQTRVQRIHWLSLQCLARTPPPPLDLPTETGYPARFIFIILFKIKKMLLFAETLNFKLLTSQQRQVTLQGLYIFIILFKNNFEFK